MRAKGWLVAGTAMAMCGSAMAADAMDDSFGLGEIIVTADRPGVALVDDTSLSNEAMRLFSRNTLDDAVGLMPGVSASNTGGSRNERLIFVRGFDRFQVPLSIDGIRVYLPADNRLDYGRFLTPDIAKVQVAKGYASVLDGPGGLGGAINLVTRKPTKEVEVEASGSFDLDRDGGDTGYTAFAMAGTRQESWYAQVSGSRRERNYFTLSDDFTPTANEDGGKRERSDSEDWRINAKLGYTPNATDEYSLSYTRQEGSKNAPLHVTDGIGTQRHWSWPYWDIDSVYFLSSTGLTDSVTLKTRAYYNRFDNLLQAFNDRTQSTQTLPRAFDSYYEDEAYGGSAELAVKVSEIDTLKLAAHFRRDRHVEFQTVFSPARFTEPDQVATEDTGSLAVENSLALTPALNLTVGAGYDWRDLRRAEDWTGTSAAAGSYVIYPIRDSHAWNGQAALDWQVAEGQALFARVSSRTRFPTIFERFSSRFGGATSNPDLDAERATNWEVGGSGRWAGIDAEAALFYSDLTDSIVSVPFLFNGQAVSQSRNAGSGTMKGLELSLAVAVDDALTLGGNYTFTDRDIDDPSNAAFRATGVPKHKAFLYAQWSPVEALRVIPSLDLASDRWTVNTAGTLYYQTGDYALANLRVEYSLTDGIDVGIGARNLFDANYQLADGFPEEGRSYSLNVRARY